VPSSPQTQRPPETLSLSQMCRWLSQPAQKPAGVASARGVEADTAPAVRVNGRVEGDHSQHFCPGFHSKTRENSVCPGTSCFCSREDVTAPHVPSKRSIPWRDHGRAGTKAEQGPWDVARLPAQQLRSVCSQHCLLWAEFTNVAVSASKHESR